MHHLSKYRLLSRLPGRNKDTKQTPTIRPDLTGFLQPDETWLPSPDQDFGTIMECAIESIASGSPHEESPSTVTLDTETDICASKIDQDPPYPISDTVPVNSLAEMGAKPITVAWTPSSKLLQLPLEIREMIYYLLFRGLCMKKKESAPRESLGRDTSFAPYGRARGLYHLFNIYGRAPALHNILLTCRQCYDEGIAPYYRSAKVINFGHLEPWCLRKPPSCRALKQTLDCSYADPQCVPTYCHTKLVLSGVTSNLSMIMRFSQDFVETGPSWLSNFHFAQLVRQITIKLPLKRFIYDELQPDVACTDSKPSDEQLVAGHLEYLPTATNGYYLRYNQRDFVIPTRHKHTEEEMTQKLIEQSDIRLVVRYPIRYFSHGRDVWEICEYDLRAWPSVHRTEVSVETVRLEEFPDRITSIAFW